MLNPFPIMFLSLLAHAILRTVTGGVFVAIGLKHLRSAYTGHVAIRPILVLSAIIELAIGSMFVVGFFTQYAALAALAYLALLFVFRTRVSHFTPAATTQVLLFGIALSLFITGAGAFALDMPF